MGAFYVLNVYVYITVWYLFCLYIIYCLLYVLSVILSPHWKTFLMKIKRLVPSLAFVPIMLIRQIDQILVVMLHYAIT